MFFLWSVVLVDLLPGMLAAALIVTAHRRSRTARAFNAWARALGILGAQLILVATLMALLSIAVFSYPDLPDPPAGRPIPLMAYLAALLWCSGPALSGIALRAASRSLRRKVERSIMPPEIEAFS
jgi:cytochrome c biogenesis factor